MRYAEWVENTYPSASLATLLFELTRLDKAWVDHALLKLTGTFFEEAYGAIDREVRRRGFVVEYESLSLTASALQRAARPPA